MISCVQLEKNFITTLKLYNPILTLSLMTMYFSGNLIPFLYPRTRSSLFKFLTKTFFNFISRWTRPKPCKYRKPSTTSNAIRILKQKYLLSKTYVLIKIPNLKCKLILQCAVQISCQSFHNKQYRCLISVRIINHRSN
jgi:hypothetical protein